MLSISLHSISLHGPHGMYAEEADNGNDFEVDVTVRLPAQITDEWPLIDYARINELVRQVVKGARVPLLEMLVRDVWTRIRSEWPQLTHIKVSIRKLRPAIKGNIKSAEVCFEGS